MKKIKYIFILILSFFLIQNVKAMPNPTSSFYVNDSANIISDEVEEYIVTHSKSLEDKTKAQIVVVTVKNLEGQDIESYATEMFRRYGIGDKEKNNGLLLLLAYEERKFRVEVGYGLEEVLPDGLTGRYQDEYIIPYLKNNDWDNGIKNGYNAFLKKVLQFYNISSSDIESPTSISGDQSQYNLNEELFSIWFFDYLILLEFLLMFSRKKYNRVGILLLIVPLIINIICLYNIYKIGISVLLFTLLLEFIIFIVVKIFPGNSFYHSSNGGGFFGGGSFGGGGSSGGGGSTRGF